jgi:hypothetical protein
LLTGAIATSLGTPEAVELFAVIVVIAALVAAVTMPQVRNFRAEGEGPEPPAGGGRPDIVAVPPSAVAAGSR